MTKQEIKCDCINGEGYIYEYPDDRKMRFCGEHNCSDGYPTLEEARDNCFEILESYYDGSFYVEAAKDAAYSKQERWATGGGDY